jgi:ATP-binding cassette subfamily B protein
VLKLVKYLKPYTAIILCAIALLFLQANCDLALPDYMADIVNTGVMSGNNSFILKKGAAMLGITLLGTAASVTVGLLASRTAAGVAHDLRSHLFRKVQQFTNAEFDQFSTASLITRTTNDITQIQNVLVMMVRLIFYAPIMGVGGIIKAIASSAPCPGLLGLPLSVWLERL